MSKTKNKEEVKAKKKTVGGDLHLNPKYYEELGEHKIYSTEKKIAKIFGVKKIGVKKLFLKIISKSKRPYGWRFNYGVDLYNSLGISRLIQGIRRVAKKLGWKVGEQDNIERLKIQLREKEEAIINLEQVNKGERLEHEKIMKLFRKQQDKIFKSKTKDFHGDIEKLKKIIKKAESQKIPEEELQEFLYYHPWFFGTEYVNAEPQKIRGAHSKFDFYLERFNKTNDIVEIKLLSDSIINKDGSISAKVIQAVDQLINYMESSIASAHSTVISEEEGIHELRPRGVVIIGKDDSEKAKKKLHMWNYQFAHIKILTYKDIVKKAQSLLKHIKEKGNKSNSGSI